MNFKLPNKFVATLAKGASKVKQYSPQICMAVGTITSIAAIIESVKCAPKVKAIIEAHKNEIDDYKEVLEAHPDEYSNSDYQKDVTRLCLITTGKIAKTIAIPAAMELTSLACFFGAHKIMCDRNKLLSAALASSMDAYNSYRNKVIDAIGEEKEEQIRLGTTQEKITKEIEDPETGKTKKISQRIDVFDPENLGVYDILWVEGDPGFDQSDQQRKLFIFSITSMYRKLLYEEHLKDKVCLAQIAEYFKGKDAWNREEHIVAGYSKDDPDQDIIIRQKPVMVKDPETGYLLDAEILTFNCPGSIVPRFVKTK